MTLPRDAADVAGGVLDADDIGKFGQPLHCVDRHVDDATRRNIVDDDRNPDRVIDGLEVLVEPFLRRLVVIGRDHEDGVRAGLFSVERERDRFGRVVRAGARDDRNPPARFVDADVDRAAVFVVGQRRAFAGRADRHQPMRSRCNLPVDQRAVGLLVEFAAFEGRDQRRHRSMKLGPLSHFAHSVQWAGARPSPRVRAQTHSPDPAFAKGKRRAAAMVNLSSALSVQSRSLKWPR
jgi:hypothetical protein